MISMRFHRLAASMFTLLVVGGLVCRANAAELVTAPYLQNVHPTGITIMWELDEGVPATVEYGAASFDHTAYAAAMESPAGTAVYKSILKELEPGTIYQYRVLLDGADSGVSGQFETAPSGSRPFAFAVWSDSQGNNHDAYPVDIYEPTKSMMTHMAESGIDFAVTCGDLAEHGAAYEDTRKFYLDRVAKCLGQTVPWFNAWGNHDDEANAAIRLFADMPSKARPGYYPGYGSFSYDYAGCHFVCIDFATMREDITGWLEDDLKSQANRDARYTFLFVHVPPFCELWIDGDADLRAKLVPLMEQYGVDACFSGHTHEYERGYLNGVYYCITGGGSWLDLGEPVVKDWPHMQVGGAQDMTGVDNGLVNEYVRVELDESGWTATCHAFKPSGEYIGVLDTFSSAEPDTDSDGLLDLQEAVLGTDPNRADADTVMAAVMTDSTSKRAPKAEPVVFMTEDFDELSGSLSPAQDEKLDASLLGWTHQAPGTWSINNDGMPAQGVQEWQGWSFTSRDFWVTASGDQGRSASTKLNGVFAVADADEWDDKDSPTEKGTFDSALLSPPVKLAAGQTAYLEFDCDYRQEGTQTGDVLVSFDGGPDYILARYDGSTGDVSDKHVVLELPTPAQDAEATLKWRFHNAGNNWYWAIDNIMLSDTPPAPRAPSPFGNKRALIIGIDGMRADSAQLADTPNLDALRAQGAYSWKACVSKGQHTSSGPGWSSILTGVWEEKHNVNNNEFEQPRYDEFPPVLARIKAMYPTAYVSTVVDWAPINEHILKEADFRKQGLKDAEVASVAAHHIVDDGPDLLFVHFDELDGAGHKGGYQPDNPMYVGKLAEIDRHVGQLMRAVDDRKAAHPGEEWLVVAVTDHGGTIEKSHGGMSEEEVFVPIVFSGDGIANGVLPEDAAIVDVTPTVLSYLGVKIDPAWHLDGAVRGLAAPAMMSK